MPKGYIIARVKIHDMDAYKSYMAVSPDTLGAYDGRFMVRGGRSEVLEGPDDGRRTVIVEFPSYEIARESYFSDLYQAAKALREDVSDGHFILVEGLN